MATSLHTSTFTSGDKGAIFTLDVAFAIFIMIIVLVTAAYYLSIAEEPTTLRQMERTGYDIVAVLNYRGEFHTLDNFTIHNISNNITPPGYRIKINLTGSFPTSPLVTNNTIDYNSTIISGAIPVTVYNASTKTRYTAIARFYLWPR